jgi:hypothetical protein
MASNYLYVARDRSRFWSTTQLTLQYENPLVFLVAGGLRRQVILNDAYAALGIYCERRPFSHDLQTVQGK